MTSLVTSLCQEFPGVSHERLDRFARSVAGETSWSAVERLERVANKYSSELSRADYAEVEAWCDRVHERAYADGVWSLLNNNVFVGVMMETIELMRRDAEEKSGVVGRAVEVNQDQVQDIMAVFMKVCHDRGVWSEAEVGSVMGDDFVESLADCVALHHHPVVRHQLVL